MSPFKQLQCSFSSVFWVFVLVEGEPPYQSQSLADWNRFSTRISSTLTSFKQHPHSMMLPPPCFTVGVVFLGLWEVLGLCRTLCFSWSVSWSNEHVAQISERFLYALLSQDVFTLSVASLTLNWLEILFYKSNTLIYITLCHRIFFNPTESILNLSTWHTI